MQTSQLTSWPSIVVNALVAIFTAGAVYFTAFLNNKKRPTDIHESTARTGLMEAQTRQVDLQVNLSGADIALRALDRAALALSKQDAIHHELEAAWAENNLLTEQNRRMAAILRAHGIKFNLQEGK